MIARFGVWRPLPVVAAGVAALLGITAAISPLIAAAVAAALVFGYVVFIDLAAGLAILAFLSFLDILPASSSLSPSKGVGALLALAWIARVVPEWRQRRDFFADRPYLVWTMTLFVLWAVVSLTWAAQIGSGITALTRYVPNILLLPIAFSAVRTKRDMVLVLGAIVAGAAVAAAYAIIQPAGPEGVEAGARATGTIGDPNEFAAVLLVGLAVGTGFVLGRRPGSAIGLLSLIAVPLCAAGIFLSLSRGGLVAFAIVLLSGTIFAGRWRAAFSVALALIAIGGMLYFTQFASTSARERITTAGNGTGRLSLWTVGWRMVEAHPITGVGVGNFQAVSADYALQPGELQRGDLIFSNAPKVTHNTYLELAAEMGFPGALLFIAIVLGGLASALRAAAVWASRGDRRSEALARSVFLGLVGMLAADFFISYMYSKLLWVMIAMGPAMLMLARSEGGDLDHPPPSTVSAAGSH